MRTWDSLRNQICGAGRKAIPSREMMFLGEEEENVLLQKVKELMSVDWEEMLNS